MAGVIIYIVISMLFGVISCFLGKKLYFPIMMLTVFLAVVAISFSFFEVTATNAAITVVVGALAALLARFIYKLGVFLLGCLLGANLGNYLALMLPESSGNYHTYFIIAIALIVGICALKWCDILIMAATAYNGAGIMAVPLYFLVVEFRQLENYAISADMNLTVLNLSQYLSGDFAAQNAQELMIITVVIAVIGFICQYRDNK